MTAAPASVFGLDLIEPGRAYAGVGSRETPEEILQVMTAAAQRLALAGMTLRSGHAPGADQAFEAGAPDDMAEIFLPWAGFENARRGVTLGADMTGPCFDLARRFHPAFDRLGAGARKLMARNGQQVLGAHLDDPAAFVLCWTPRARAGGGTGQAIRIARAYGVPTFDLADPWVLAQVCGVLSIEPPAGHNEQKAETEPGLGF